MYLLMQMGSKPGYYNPLPLGITPSSVFQYLGIHIQFAHPKFQNLQICPMLNYLLWTFRTKPFSFHKLLLLVLRFQLIPKSRNFVAANLLMFPCWVVSAKWCPPHFQHFTGCFIFTCSISFESSCLEHFLMDRLDECPIIDPLSFPLQISPIMLLPPFADK